MPQSSKKIMNLGLLEHEVTDKTDGATVEEAWTWKTTVVPDDQSKKCCKKHLTNENY